MTLKEELSLDRKRQLANPIMEDPMWKKVEDLFHKGFGTSFQYLHTLFPYHKKLVLYANCESGAEKNTDILNIWTLDRSFALGFPYKHINMLGWVINALVKISPKFGVESEYSGTDNVYIFTMILDD